MRSIIGALEVDHAVYTTERGAMTPAAMGVKLLLGEDIAAALHSTQRLISMRQTSSSMFLAAYLALERHHVLVFTDVVAD